MKLCLTGRGRERVGNKGGNRLFLFVREREREKDWKIVCQKVLRLKSWMVLHFHCQEYSFSLSCMHYAGRPFLWGHSFIMLILTYKFTKPAMNPRFDSSLLPLTFFPLSPFIPAFSPPRSFVRPALWCIKADKLFYFRSGRQIKPNCWDASATTSNEREEY